MPRTATTFFQHELFPLLSDLDYHQLPETHFDSSFQRLLYQDESLYHASAVENGLKQKSIGDVSLFSNENFIGQSLYMAHGNRSRTASRLKAAFPEAEIILFLRGQVDLLKSLYAIDVSGELSSVPEEFVTEDQGGYRTGGADWRNYAVYNTLEPTEHLEGYRYKELLDLYHAHFKKVHVFLFEEFRADPVTVSRRLVELMAQPWSERLEKVVTKSERVNASVGGRTAERMRRLNRWYPLVKGRWPLEGMFHRMKRRTMNGSEEGRIDFGEEKERRMREYFKEANEDLVKGYPDLGVERFRKEYCLNA